MSITVFDDVILDECVFIAGATGVQNRLNDRSVNQGGYATVNAVRDVTLRQFDFGAKPMDIDSWLEVEGCYEVTDAGAFGFLIKDPKDQNLNVGGSGALQGYMQGVEAGAPGFGNGGPVYGVRKLYKASSSSRTKSRPITRPNGAWVVSRAGTPVSPTASAGPVTFMFAPDASENITAITAGASTVVTLNAAITGFAIGGRLWLQGVTGADAALLNDLSHEITNIAGAVYTLATNTAGKTLVATGQGRKYPQPTEALTVAGEFFVPVQFATDNLDWDIMRPGPFESRLVQGPACTLVEIREV